jgi:hypothetical protein
MWCDSRLAANGWPSMNLRTFEDSIRACTAALIRPILVAVPFLLHGCATTQPLTLGDVGPGTEVRVTSRTVAEPIATVLLIRQVNGSIEVADEGGESPYRISLSQIESLEIAHGRAFYPATLVGASAGGLGGLVVGMVCSSNCPRTSTGSRIFAPLVGIAVGSFVGAISGAIWAPPRWVRVRIR